MKRCFFVNQFIFYVKISENVYVNMYNKTKNCPPHGFKSLSVCDMSFKFLTKEFREAIQDAAHM